MINFQFANLSQMTLRMGVGEREREREAGNAQIQIEFPLFLLTSRPV